MIANGIDVASFREPCDIRAIRRSLGIPLDAPLIGTVGRLAEIKRQDLLILAFANVKSRIPDAHLLLVGDGPLLHELTNLVGDLGLGDHVHFAGYQPHAAPYLQAMDVFALTSRSEGMPQALLEAAVIGVPIVASRVGGIPEVIESGRTGLLIEPGDEAGLTTARVRGLCEPGTRPGDERGSSGPGYFKVRHREDGGRIPQTFRRVACKKQPWHMERKWWTVPWRG